MIYSKIQESLPLLLSVQYTHTQHAVYDYSQLPRPCYNFVFMLEGEGRIQANGEEFHIKKGDILLHGHTHVPKREETDACVYLNPGSVSIPKENSVHGYMTLTENIFEWKSLDGEVYNRYEA